MTLAELDSRLALLVEQRQTLIALRQRWLLNDSEEGRECLRLLERGIRHGDGVPRDLDGVNVGVGLQVIEREIAGLTERRELLVEQQPSEAELKIIRGRVLAVEQEAAMSRARLLEAWSRLVEAIGTVDDRVSDIVNAANPLHEIPLRGIPDLDYVGLVGAALRTLAGTGGTLDDPTLRNELMVARARRVHFGSAATN